jgi:hypothetical protein
MTIAHLPTIEAEYAKAEIVFKVLKRFFKTLSATAKTYSPILPPTSKTTSTQTVNQCRRLISISAGRARLLQVYSLPSWAL